MAKKSPLAKLKPGEFMEAPELSDGEKWKAYCVRCKVKGAVVRNAQIGRAANGRWVIKGTHKACKGSIQGFIKTPAEAATPAAA